MVCVVLFQWPDCKFPGHSNCHRFQDYKENLLAFQNDGFSLNKISNHFPNVTLICLFILSMIYQYIDLLNALFFASLYFLLTAIIECHECESLKMLHFISGTRKIRYIQKILYTALHLIFC